VVYAADAAVLENTGLVVTNHGFLALPLNKGGLKHRWLRQDGYTVGVPNWQNLEASRNLDFARCVGVECFTFESCSDDTDIVRNLGDLETIEGDPLAASVRAVFESIAIATDSSEAVGRLIAGTKTLDAKGKLIVEIESLIEKAQQFGRSEKDLAQLQALLAAANSQYWDTSWEASLNHWSRELMSSPCG
jgi:hypothetical protein